MIVLDENIQDYELADLIAKWYSGQVVSVKNLRPTTLIKDDGIATLLRAANNPAFVTINVKDFWQQFRADQRYCVIALLLRQEQARQISATLRSLFSLPEFRTKANRMGKIVYLRPSRLEYYTIDRQIHYLPWPPE